MIGTARTLIAVAAACAVLGGCGSDGGSDDPQGPSDAPPGPIAIAALVEAIADERSLASFDTIEACEVDVDPAAVALEDQPGVDNTNAHVICGTDEDDRIEGGDGDDVLVGGAGNDEIYATEETDGDYTANATNVLIGGTGNDKLVDAYGPGIIFAGPGDDEILIADPAAEYVDCGPGTDSVHVATQGTPDELVDCERIERIDLDPTVMESATRSP